MQLELTAVRVANQELVNSRVALGLNTSQYYLCSWDRNHQAWRVDVCIGGRTKIFGFFHEEEDAGHFADVLLHLMGAEERYNFFSDGKPTGYGGGQAHHAHQVSGLTAHSDATRLKWRGVTGHRGGWRGQIKIADCLPEKPCVAHMGGVKCTCKDCKPDTPCRVAQRRGARCTCKQVLKKFTHPTTGSYFKTAEEAARRYNQVALDNNLHKPPYSKVLNPPPGVAWDSPLPDWAKPKRPSSPSVPKTAV